VVAEYPGPGGPDCMELLADGKTLLVSSRWARKLSFIDIESRKVVHQVDVGRRRTACGRWTMRRARSGRHGAGRLRRCALARCWCSAAAAPAEPATSRCT
jgi:hypothetical protein